jgi:hypothetical protein
MWHVTRRWIFVVVDIGVFLVVAVAVEVVVVVG